MYNSDTELLFPERVISELTTLRGEPWQRLVQMVLQGSDITQKTSFVLMMVHQCGCVSCSTHSFRATRGCTLCAQQTVRRFRGSDAEFIKQFEQACDEVSKHLEKCAEIEKKLLE